MMISSGAEKRPLEKSDPVDTDIVYRFKILLPNGTSVGLRIRDPPEPVMSFVNFIKLVKNECDRASRSCESTRKRRPITWEGDLLYLEDANDNKARTRINLGNFKPFKCHILRFHDGSDEVVNTFENMWDLTPGTDLLKELPEEYTFVTALADLIDNSLQAVWSNEKKQRRLIKVDVLKDRISIFDTGPGMDDSEENSIVKWGKMGASLHRSYKAHAIGGKPPYLMPFFGMFGYGGPIATMHLGRHAVVSSKTKASKKVYTLHLEREALISSPDEVTWKTDGGLRGPLEDEIGLSPHGSFTKVEIFDPKVKGIDVFQLQCKLKDIYFPYIQCDEVSTSGKTETPIAFQVNGVDLAEIEGGEVAITNLHSCNGEEFDFQLRLYHKKDIDPTKNSGSRASQEANCRLRCVYLPVVQGKENIESILEKLEAIGCGFPENYERFSRVAVRRLGRLLPDARWIWLPFMEPKQKKGDKAHLLKRCCLRVKCFVETDAGFNPTPSKTDLAHHNPFTVAIKNFGSISGETESDVNVEIHRCGKLLSLSQLEKEYQDWVIQMHSHHDEEIETGEDQPVLLVAPPNKKALGISSDVVRVHQTLKRKGSSWNSGEKIKILKGAGPGCHKNNIYATIEYFLIEGLQGDARSEARMICRPLDVPDENGCILAVNGDSSRLDLHGSLSLPISVIDGGKCQAVQSHEWDYQVERQRIKIPSFIDVLNDKHCQELEVDGALPFIDRVQAGQAPPREIVAVVRPNNSVSSSASKSIDQKYIIRKKLDMLLEVKFKSVVENTRDASHIYSARVTPSSCKGFYGLYIFPLGHKFPELFKTAGCYTFSFSVEESSCEKCVKKVHVHASGVVGMWKLLNNEKVLSYNVRVGSCFPSFLIGCYDIFGNRTMFTSIPDLLIKLQTRVGVLALIGEVKASISEDKFVLEVKDILIQCNELDKIRPSYKATLMICQHNELFSVSIPCQVMPGPVWHVIAEPPTLGKLLPGFIVEQLTLEMLDENGNHVGEGSEVELNVDGFHIKDHLCAKLKVDDFGCLQLGGILQVVAGYGKKVSITVISDCKEVFKKEFQTVERELRVASKVSACSAGSDLENLVFEVVNSKGEIDQTIHDNEKCGQSHTLMIKSDSFQLGGSIRYTFKNGCCTVPTLCLPQTEGTFCFEAFHSRYPELKVSITVPIFPAPKMEPVETKSPSLDRRLLLLESTPIIKNAANVMSLTNYEKGIEKKIEKCGLRIGSYEHLMKDVIIKKTEIEQEISALQASLEPHLLINSDDCFCTKEEVMRRVECEGKSAAAVLCSTFNESSLISTQSGLMHDVVGVVALLGTVCSSKLSRILAEYLGEDQMLAVVCKSIEGARALEKYDRNGEVDCRYGLHAEANAHGTSINGRFLVICLEDIRAFEGGFEKDNIQRKLALPHPTLPTGKILPGFQGYAVNMVDLDVNYVSTRTASNHGLRETLFYRLFGLLQVYDTRRHMEEARGYIKHGAVSLDGGILRENGFIFLGSGKPAIYFPVIPLNSPDCMDSLRLMEEKKEELGEINRELEVLSIPYNKALHKFEKLKDKYIKVVNHMEPMVKQLFSGYTPPVKTETITIDDD